MSEPISTTWPDEPAARAVVEAFRRRYEAEPEVVVRAPGRVALIGAHVDQSEGLVMPAAIDRAVWLAASTRRDETVRLRALDLDEEHELNLLHLPPPVFERGGGVSWPDYPAGVAWSLQRDGVLLPGIDVAFGGDLPSGAGVSSSAAVEVAFTLAWEALGRFVLPRAEPARVGQRAENHYLGVRSGVMDQFASCYGAADHLVLIDCRTLEHELVPVRPGLAVVVADSGVRRQLADSEFNQRRAECQEALVSLQELIPDIQTLRDVTRADLNRHARSLSPVHSRRARHVVEECDRVRSAARALRQGDLAAFGDLVRQSHVSSRELFDSSLDELDELAAAAWEHPACYGARFMGGGFGGCVAALVDATAADDVSERMQRRFERCFDRNTETFVSRIADGASACGRPAWAPGE